MDVNSSMPVPPSGPTRPSAVVSALRSIIALTWLLVLVAGVFLAGVGASAGGPSGLGIVGVLLTLVAVLGLYLWSAVFVMRNGGRGLGVLVLLFWPLGILIYLYRQNRERASIVVGRPISAFPLKKCSAVLAGTMIVLIVLGAVDGGFSAGTSSARDKKSLASSSSGPSSKPLNSALAPDATSTSTPLPTASPTETSVPTSTPVPTATPAPTSTPAALTGAFGDFIEVLLPYKLPTDVRDIEIRPWSFRGTQMKLPGTVGAIKVAPPGMIYKVGEEETREFRTILQLQVRGTSAWVMVGFDGDAKEIYEGDSVTVYGALVDQESGENAFGGTVTEQLFAADYILKHETVYRAEG